MRHSDQQSVPSGIGGRLSGLETPLTSTLQKKIVAIVDDDPGVRVAMKQLLSAFGYVSFSYSSGEAFLRTAAVSKANCVVIDVQLGDLSGVELARELIAVGLKFPIIFMTASQDAAIERQARELDCVAYLRKPFSADQLLEAIIKATDRSPPG
jgi:FixJ family two-component response regulator